MVLVNGIVDAAIDPFLGRSSRDGKPGVPQSTGPEDGAEIKSSQEIIDLRWRPSPGQYPIAYEFEQQIGHHDS